MEKYILLDINVFGILILGILILNYKHSFRFGTLSEKFFALLISSNISILITDIIAVLVKGLNHPLYRIIAYSSKALFFFSCILLYISWLYFYIVRVYRMEKIESVMLKNILPLPFVIFNLFMIATLHKGYIFSFNETNQYIRGPLFHLTTAGGFFYITVALVFIFFKRRNLGRDEYIPFVLMPLFTIFLGVLQSFIHFPMLFVWPALAIVFNGIHLTVLNTKVSKDHLTGLNNRHELDSYLKVATNEHFGNGKSLGLIMIDVDDFKKINDTMGHVVGDEVLTDCARILKKSLVGAGFIARYGGDEFMLVISDCIPDDLEQIVKKIKATEEDYNDGSHREFKLSMSIGYKSVSGNELIDLKKITHDVDQLMYDIKVKRKQLVN